MSCGYRQRQHRSIVLGDGHRHQPGRPALLRRAVYPTADNDSEADFKLANGPTYRIADLEPEQGLAREVNATKGVPTMTVVRWEWSGYDADGLPNYFFQWVGPPELYETVPHDHRDHYNGGYAFACYHHGTGLPQQPFAI